MLTGGGKISLPKITIPKVTLPSVHLIGHSDEEDYIKDGLVFWLDGIDKGGVDGKWIDLVGGVEYSLSDGAYFTSKSLVGEAIASKAINPFGFSPVTHTVSFAGRFVNSGQLLLFRSANAKDLNCCFWHIDDSGSPNPVQITMSLCGTIPKICYLIGVPDSAFIDVPIVGAVSADRAVVNGYVTTNKGGTCTTNSRRVNSVGQKGCEIYSIRIYDRLLSEAEMRHNQEVDRRRFKLTFPEPIMTLEYEEDDYEGDCEGEELREGYGVEG